jgi:hypothetical protein
MPGQGLDRRARRVVGAVRPAGQVGAHGDDDGHRGAAPGHGHGDVPERHADRRLRLVHGDDDLVDGRVGQGVERDELGEPLDEVVGLALDAGEGRCADPAVVHRVGEVVGGTGRGEVDRELDVDDELLPLAALVLEHPVVAATAHPGEPDAVGCRAAHDVPRGGVRSPSASATSSASTVATTSCTRTHHTPCRATCTVVAAVATSRSSGGRAVSRLRPTAPRKVLREVPTSTR